MKDDSARNTFIMYFRDTTLVLCVVRLPGFQDREDRKIGSREERIREEKNPASTPLFRSSALPDFIMLGP
jgi:hypothetical protein